MLLSALFNRGWDVSLPPVAQLRLALACLPQEVWWGWVPWCSAKGVARAKCCVNVEDYHLPDASSSSCLQPSLQPGGRIFFLFKLLC